MNAIFPESVVVNAKASAPAVVVHATTRGGSCDAGGFDSATAEALGMTTTVGVLDVLAEIGAREGGGDEEQAAKPRPNKNQNRMNAR